MNELFQNLGLEAYAEDPQVRSLAASYLELYRSSPEPQVSVDAKTRCIVFVNDALCRMLGYTREEMVGTPILMFIHPDNRSVSKDTFAQLEEDHLVRDVALDFAHKSGDRIPTLVSSNGILDKEGNVARSNSVIRVLDDQDIAPSSDTVTHLEQQLQASQDQVKKLEELCFQVSSDLREPVRNVQALSRMIRAAAESENPTRMHDYMDHLNKTSNRLAGMVGGLNEWATDGSRASLEAVSLRDICLSVHDDLSAVILESNAVLVVENVPAYKGYRLELRTMMRHLVENAIKFKHPSRLPEIHISAETTQDTLQIWVRDNGQGIAEEHHTHLFDPFYRLPEHHAVVGAGMGLARCKKIMQLHKGSIGVQSKPGIGTAMVLTFPLLEEA